MSAFVRLSSRAIKVLRVAALALIVAVACVRVARTWTVFSATADEPQHIAAGIEWWGGTDVVQHEPWRTVNPPLARIAVGLGPHLAGTRSTPFLRDMLYTGPGYARNLMLSRPGILPFLALAIVLTWLLARRAYGETTVQTRLHQAYFRRDVLFVYSNQCCVCELKVRPLLQGAHIVPDSEAVGAPVVQNGLSLCSLHHAAYDPSTIRIKADYTVAVENEWIEAGDGFARASLSEFDGRRIHLPSDATHHPNPDFLNERFRR